MTDPELALEFVPQTAVDPLTVAVGNVHGHTSVQRIIDLERLAAIAAEVEIPLVLHGAFGLEHSQLRPLSRSA